MKRRLQNGLGHARDSKADYLAAFLFMDMIVDDYFRIVQILSDQIENIDAVAETQRIEQESIEKIPGLSTTSLSCAVMFYQ